MAQQKFVLVGPYAGKDFKIGDHQFENGEFTFEGGASQIEPLARLFSHYGAVTAEQAELLALREKKAEEVVQQDPPTPEPEQEETEEEAEEEGDQSDAVTLEHAISRLDPENDEHWTSNNLPAIDYLEKLTGTDVSRAQVEAVAKGYTRAKARELLA